MLSIKSVKQNNENNFDLNNIEPDFSCKRCCIDCKRWWFEENRSSIGLVSESRLNKQIGSGLLFILNWIINNSRRIDCCRDSRCCCCSIIDHGWWRDSIGAIGAIIVVVVAEPNNILTKNKSVFNSGQEQNYILFHFRIRHFLDEFDVWTNRCKHALNVSQRNIKLNLTTLHICLFVCVRFKTPKKSNLGCLISSSTCTFDAIFCVAKVGTDRLSTKIT